MRPVLRPGRRCLQPLIRTAVALGGLLAAVIAMASLPKLGQAEPRWAWRFFIAWCVATPYWHYAEYRWLRDPAQTGEQRADFLYQQTLSRAVWLGVALVFGVHLLRAG